MLFSKGSHSYSLTCAQIVNFSHAESTNLSRCMSHAWTKKKEDRDLFSELIDSPILPFLNHMVPAWKHGHSENTVLFSEAHCWLPSNKKVIFFETHRGSEFLGSEVWVFEVWVFETPVFTKSLLQRNRVYGCPSFYNSVRQNLNLICSQFKVIKMPTEIISTLEWNLGKGRFSDNQCLLISL